MSDEATRHNQAADLRSIPVASASLDGIWCCAALLHVPENQTLLVLKVLAEAWS